MAASNSLFPTDSKKAIAFNQEGVYRHCAKKYNEAIEQYQAALKVQPPIPEQSKQHPHIAASYSGIGYAHCELGEYKEAIEPYKTALNITIANYRDTPNHRNVVAAYWDLINAYVKLKNDEQIVNYSKKLLDILETAPDEYCLEIGSASQQLGKAYNQLGNTSGAEECFKKVELRISAEAVRGFSYTTDYSITAFSQNNPHKQVNQMLEAEHNRAAECHSSTEVTELNRTVC